MAILSGVLEKSEVYAYNPYSTEQLNLKQNSSTFWSLSPFFEPAKFDSMVFFQCSLSNEHVYLCFIKKYKKVFL